MQGRPFARPGEPGRLHAAVAALAATVALTGIASAAYQTATHRPAAAGVRALTLRGGPPALRLLSLPVTATYGDTVHVSGVLTTASGVPLAGRAVDVVTGPTRTARRTAVVATARTDSLGVVAATFRLSGGGAVALRFAGEAATSYSDAVRVTVAPRVTVAATTRASGGAWVSTLHGHVTPAAAGWPVRLDARTAHGAWRRVATVRLDRGGAYTFTVRHALAGAYVYRVVRPAGGGLAEGSATFTVRLRTPPSRALPPPVGTGRVGPGRLLVTGDSFAYYLGEQVAAARGSRPTTVESRPSTGLARADYFDWLPRARAQMAERPSGVVVFMGANDCQPLRAGGTGAWTAVGTASWAAEYRRRAATLLAVYAREGGTRPVYWVGLPIARKPDIAACYGQLNAATAAAARDVGGVTFVDSWSLYAVDGQYSDVVGGVAARQRDGIHLTFEGTRLLTRRVVAALGP